MYTTNGKDILDTISKFGLKPDYDGGKLPDEAMAVKKNKSINLYVGKYSDPDKEIIFLEGELFLDTLFKSENRVSYKVFSDS